MCKLWWFEEDNNFKKENFQTPGLFFPANRRRRFFLSFMKATSCPGFPGLIKPGLKTGTKLLLIYNESPGIPEIPVFFVKVHVLGSSCFFFEMYFQFFCKIQ